MKVLHVCVSLSRNWGGPVSVVEGLTQALSRRNIECTVFSVVGQRVGMSPIEIPGVRTETFPVTPLAALWNGHSTAFMRAVAKEAKRSDLLHIHEIWHYPHFASARTFIRAGKPFVVTIHGALQHWPRGDKTARVRLYWMLVQKRLLNRAYAVQVLTDEERWTIERLRVQSKTALIPNGVEVEQLSQCVPAAPFVEKNPRLAGKKIVLFLGRINRLKGLDILVAAAAQVLEKRRDVCFVAAGPAELDYLRDVRSMIRGDMERHWLFTGRVDGQDKFAVFSAADILVQPSRSEGQSMVVLEGMAAGLPVIASPAASFQGLAESGAVIVVPNNPGQLADAIIRLLDDAPKRKAMGEAGKLLVGHQYTWDVIAGQMTGLYQEALKSG